MQTCLAVGLPQDAGYAATFLRQVGVPSVRLSSLDAGVERGIRVFLWNRAESLMLGSGTEAPPVAIITDHGCLAKAVGERIAGRETSLRFAVDDSRFGDRSFYARHEAIGLTAQGHGTCYAADGRPLPGTGLRCENKGNVHLLSLPWDVVRYRQGESWAHRAHYSPAAGTHFLEVGACFATGALRRLLFELLKWAFSLVEQPMLRVSHRQADGPHFSVRIDADGFSRSSTECVLDIAARMGLQFTWFIDVEGWGTGLPMVRDLVDAGQDVQLHCYRHMTYMSRRTNLANLRAGRRLLATQGVEVSAVVSPMGYYYRGFQEAVQDAGFRYSSEFGFGTDDLPACVASTTGHSDSLQIPAHPASLGALRDGGLDDTQVFRHFRERIPAIARADGLGVFYSHPLGRLETCTTEFEAMLRRFLDQGMVYTNLSDYARLWCRRPIDWEATWDGSRIHVSGAPVAAPFYWEIVCPERLQGAVECNVPARRYRDEPGIVDRYEQPASADLSRCAGLDREFIHLAQTPAWRWHVGYVRSRVRQVFGKLRRGDV